MYPQHKIARDHPSFHDKGLYFSMSGTSQSAAVVSGIAALVLSANPGLSNDDVKCRLMAGSRPAIGADGNWAVSPFRQGAGLIDAFEAVYGTAAGCANRGLDVSADLAGDAHYAGPARVDEDGSFFIEGLPASRLGSAVEGSGALWADGVLWSGSALWADGILWNDSILWTDTALWSDSILWTDGVLWADSALWTDADTEAGPQGSSIGISWVDQE